MLTAHAFVTFPLVNNRCFRACNELPKPPSAKEAQRLKETEAVAHHPGVASPILTPSVDA